MTDLAFDCVTSVNGVATLHRLGDIACGVVCPSLDVAYALQDALAELRRTKERLREVELESARHEATIARYQGELANLRHASSEARAASAGVLSEALAVLRDLVHGGYLEHAWVGDDEKVDAWQPLADRIDRLLATPAPVEPERPDRIAEYGLDDPTDAAVESHWERRDARRYRRLRVLGAAPSTHPCLEAGTVLCFTNLDAFIDGDIKAQPSRGEAEGAPSGAGVPPTPLTYDDLDAVIAADGRGWLESDGVIAIFTALKARGLCVGDAPARPDMYPERPPVDHKGDLVDCLLDELLDRGGFDDWWYGCDSDIREGMAAKLREIVKAHAESEGAPVVPRAVTADVFERLAQWLDRHSSGIGGGRNGAQMVFELLGITVADKEQP